MNILSIVLLLVPVVLAGYMGSQLLMILKRRYKDKETHATATYKLSGDEISGSLPMVFLLYCATFLFYNKVTPAPLWYCDPDKVGWIISIIGVAVYLVMAIVTFYGFYAAFIKMTWSIKNGKMVKGLFSLAVILVGIFAVIVTVLSILNLGKAFLLVFVVLFFVRNFIKGLIFGVDPVAPTETITIKDKDGRTHEVQRINDSLYGEVGSSRKWRELDEGEFVEDIDRGTIERQKIERERKEQFEKIRERQIRDIK